MVKGFKGRRYIGGIIPPDNEALLISIFNNTYFIKNSKNRSNAPISDGELINEVPNSNSGGKSLFSSDGVGIPTTDILRYNSRLGGLVNLDNQPIFYLQNAENINITWPNELHFCGVMISNFTFESYINSNGYYLGQVNDGLRLTNHSVTDYAPFAFDQGKPFYVRIKYDTNRQAQVFVNGVSLGGPVDTYFTGTTTQFLNRLGLGTDTNNAKWFASCLFHCNRLLTDSEASQVQTALNQLYTIGSEIPYPWYKNIGITISGNTITAAGTYYSPGGVAENVSLRKYRWYSAGTNSGAPDVTHNQHEPELDDLASWSKLTHSTLFARATNFRVDIECTDVNGNTFKSPAGCRYVYLG